MTYYVIKKMFSDLIRSRGRYYFVVAVNSDDEEVLQGVLHAERLSSLPPLPVCYVEYLSEFKCDSAGDPALKRSARRAYRLLVERAGRLLDEVEFRVLMEGYLRNCPYNIRALEIFMETTRSRVLRYPLILNTYDINAKRLKLGSYRVSVNRDSMFARIDFLDAVRGFVVWTVDQTPAEVLLPYSAEDVDPEVIAEMEDKDRERVRRILAVALENVRYALSKIHNSDLERAAPVIEHTLFLIEMLR